jgi:hypothetical protein
MPVEFLSDEQVAAYGRVTRKLPAGELERFFYLDDADRDLVARRRSDHHRLGFASVRAVSRRARVDARGGPVTLFEQATGRRHRNIRRLRGGRRALRLVFAVAGVVVVVPSSAAVVAAARRDAVRQEREPCVVDCADDLVVGVRCLVGDPAVRPADDFSGRSGPRGRTTNICSACLLGLAFVSWIERNASNTAYVKLRDAVTCGHP